MMANEWLNDPGRSKRVTQETAKAVEALDLTVGWIGNGRSKQAVQEATSTRENFHDKLTWWIQISDDEDGEERARLDLIQACGAVWNDAGQMPEPFWHDAQVAIGNWKNAVEWENKGRTYAGAARHIRPRLNAGAA